MRMLIVLVFVIVNSAFSNDLSLSKDSLKVYNNSFDSFRDQIIIKNNSNDSIFLDSAYLLFDVFDTTGMHSKIKTHWIEYMYGDFGWDLIEIGKNKYKLEKDYFSPNDTAIPLRFFPKDSCVLLDFQIGNYLVSALMPIYPKYISGFLQLYFSNNQIVEIKLYSDDLRANTISNITVRRNNHIELNHEYYLLNGRKILNANKNTKRINAFVLKRRIY